jgi:carbon starvation protein CstA
VVTESPSAQDQSGPAGVLPLTWRICTAVVGVEAFALLGYSLYLAFRSEFGHPSNASEGVAIGIYLLILAAGIVAVFVGMLRGRRWSRSPAITANLIVVGMGWYLIKADQMVIGILTMIVGVVTIGALATPGMYNALEARHQAHRA